MKEIKLNNLLKEELVWKPALETKTYYITDFYEKEECWLRINDFPEEPMWTFYFKGESIDFDETPKKWKIQYRSDFKNKFK